MWKQKLLIPSILSTIYALLCIIVFFFHITGPETEGIPFLIIIFLSLPWSFLAVLFISSIEMISSTELPYAGYIIIIIISMIMNITLIFIGTKKIMNKQE
jgi:hypothetical protein